MAPLGLEGAYNAEATLLQTHSEVLEQDYVDLVIVVDDASKDRTVNIARGLPKTMVFVHDSTSVTVATKRPATGKPSSQVVTLSSWCTRIIIILNIDCKLD
jgi:GT2 family glycosyltransferase